MDSSESIDFYSSQDSKQMTKKKDYIVLSVIFSASYHIMVLVVIFFINYWNYGTYDLEETYRS